MICCFCFVLLPLGLESGECDVISLYLLCCSVNGSFCFVCCVFDSVNCLMKQFAMCLGVFVIMLLNVMDLLNVVGGALLDISMYGLPNNVCVVPVVPVSVKMLLPYVLFVFLYVGSYLLI